MKTYVSLYISNAAGDLASDGAATLAEVAAKVAQFAAKGPFQLTLTESDPETIQLRLDEEREAAEDAPELDESMDGDFDSAMASAGLGTDEDYGQFNDPDAGCFGDE